MLYVSDSENLNGKNVDSNQASDQQPVNFIDLLNNKQITYSRRKIRQKMMGFQKKKEKILKQQEATQTLPLLDNMGTTITHRNSLKATKRERILSRKKRYFSLPRSLEVMVTADNGMMKTHEDVEHYVLTLMAIVSGIHTFHHLMFIYQIVNHGYLITRHLMMYSFHLVGTLAPNMQNHVGTHSL